MASLCFQRLTFSERSDLESRRTFWPFVEHHIKFHKLSNMQKINFSLTVQQSRLAEHMPSHPLNVDQLSKILGKCWKVWMASFFPECSSWVWQWQWQWQWGRRGGSQKELVYSKMLFLWICSPKLPRFDLIWFLCLFRLLGPICLPTSLNWK